MNIKNRCKSIEFKTFLTVLSFNIGIVLLFWFCELMFFNVFYKNYQINNIENAVQTINSSSEDIYILAEKTAYNNELCISVIDNNYISYNYNTMKNGCELGKNNLSVRDKITEFMKSGSQKSVYQFELVNSSNSKKSESLMYALKTQNKNVFIYNNISNVSSVLNVFNEQIIYFIVIVIMISFFVAVFISKNVTKPIKIITKKSNNIGSGSYNNKFPKNGIKEIDELSETLENVQKKLNETDQMKRDLMANVSHDLKTPLTMIKAYAEMIKDISYKDENKLNEHINIIMDETDRLTLLVNDILQLSKVQNDVLMYNITQFDLVKVIKDIIKKYDLIKETENYNFILELPKKALVHADKNKIIQVIYNLVNNAINYTGDDKIVIIKVIKEEKGYKVIIKDTGKGIKKEELSYIWDKYYKNDKNHQRNVVSTGLGLSIVKEILTRHNFEYGVSSNKKDGTEFYFKINT